MSDLPRSRNDAISSGVNRGILASMYLIMLSVVLASLAASISACSATDTVRTMTFCKFTSLPVSTGLNTPVLSLLRSVAATAASSSIACVPLVGSALAVSTLLMLVKERALRISTLSSAFFTLNSESFNRFSRLPELLAMSTWCSYRFF